MPWSALLILVCFFFLELTAQVSSSRRTMNLGEYFSSNGNRNCDLWIRLKLLSLEGMEELSSLALTVTNACEYVGKTKKWNKS